MVAVPAFAPWLVLALAGRGGRPEGFSAGPGAMEVLGAASGLNLWHYSFELECSFVEKLDARLRCV